MLRRRLASPWGAAQHGTAACMGSAARAPALYCPYLPQVRAWAQWAERQAEAARLAAGLSPLPTSSEAAWAAQAERAARAAARARAAAAGEDVSEGGWVPPAPPPDQPE
jgi:hypothetical protein